MYSVRGSEQVTVRYTGSKKHLRQDQHRTSDCQIHGLEKTTVDGRVYKYPLSNQAEY